MKHQQHQALYDQYIQDSLDSYAQGDHVGALATLDSAIRFDPAQPDGFVQRGIMLAERGEHIRAERDLRTALSLRICNMASYHLALLLSNQARYHEAVVILKRAINRYPHDQDLWYQYGRMLDLTNEVDLAIDAYSHALAITGASNGELYVLRGNLYADQEQWQRAAADFEAAIAYCIRCSEVFYQFGYACLKLQRWSQAATSFTRALRDDPSNPTIYQARSIAYEALGKTLFAEQDQHMAERLRE